MIKILHISYSFKKGGAAIASNNIIKSIKKNGTKIYKYSFKNLAEENFFLFLKVLIINFFFKLINLNNKKSSFNYFKINHLRKMHKKFDIVHLHWIGNEFFSLKEILEIKNKIIWTIHDDWLKNTITHIGKEDKANNFILSFYKKKITKLKNKLFKKNIIFIAPSRYILNNLKKITKSKIYLIRHPINEKVFNLKNINTNKIIFNIGGSNVFNDKNKGSILIDKLLNTAYNHIKKNYEFIFFGSKNYKNIFYSNKNIQLNKFVQPSNVAKIFNKSNYTFVLSEVESFSLIAAESLMCGCPVICFNDNAVAELITHKQNGYLLKRNDKNCLINLMKWIKKNPNYFNRKKISAEANKEFSYESISLKYNKIYETI